MSSYLKKEGWEVESFLTGEDARTGILKKPHLWILDIMLPDVDGYQLIKEIKITTPEMPVIFISARDADLDRIVGLEMGSDDYLPKPFLPRELVIRVRKLLERVYEKHVEAPHAIISLPPYEIDISHRTVQKEKTEIDLTSKEFDLLVLFTKNPGQAFSREKILTEVWGQDYFGTDRAVDDLLRRLRKKIPEIRIETLYGFGYRLVP
ncbi:MAG: response regulator transcription factor [Atribacterota bacterium]